MRADNSRHVVAAARRRSEDTTRRAVAALRQMDTAGAVITFDSVARHAGVSRAWLYTQPELRAEIERLRQHRTPPAQPRVPDRQRGSDASLRQRLETALGRIRQLESDNRRLSAALAQALGHNRSNPTPIPPPAPPTPLPPTASQRPAVNHR
jgi:hypothetical protein